VVEWGDGALCGWVSASTRSARWPPLTGACLSRRRQGAQPSLTHWNVMVPWTLTCVQTFRYPLTPKPKYYEGGKRFWLLPCLCNLHATAPTVCQDYGILYLTLPIHQ